MLVSKTDLSSIKTVDKLLNFYKEIPILNFKEGQLLDFDINQQSRDEKITPFLKIADVHDSSEIAAIFQEVYSGKYPFKVLEDSKKIRKMIIDPHYIWIIFKTQSGDFVGCLGALLEFDKKRGYLFGFALKKNYHGKFDGLKTFICSLIYLWRRYNNEILLWTSEVRTFSSTPQYANSVVSLKPIAFLPNKDLFYDNPESEFLTITYKENTLKKFRSKQKPKIIRQVLNCYTYSQERYDLGLPEIVNPNLIINYKEISKLEEDIIMRKETDEYGHQFIKFSIKNSNSYFMFLYHKDNKNIEKTQYKSHNLEELSVFLKKFNQFIKNQNLRYFEIYVSAYQPDHQKLFNNAGFEPRGYIPSFEFNPKKGIFEDMILFNYFTGEINPNIDLNLIQESKKLKNRLDSF